MTAILRAYRRAYSGLSRAVWGLAALLFVNRCGTMVLPFLVVYLIKVEGYAEYHAIQFLSVYGVGAVAGAYTGGVLTQRFGPMRVVAASLLLSGPGYFAIPFCHTAGALIAVLLYLSFTAEIIRPAISTATAERCTPETLAQSFALNRLALNLGMSIGPAIGGALAAAGYWSLLFSINGVFCALSGLVTLAVFDLSNKHGETTTAERSPGSGNPWRDRPYLVYLTMQALVMLVFFQTMSTLPAYWTEQYGLRPDQIGLLFVINTLLIVLFEMVLTDRLRHFPTLPVVGAGAALICVGFGATAFGSGLWFAAMLAVVWTVGEMLAAPFGMTHVAQRATGRNRPAYMGLNSMSIAAAGVAAPLAGAALYRIDPNLPWWGCLAMAGVLPLGFWVLARQEEVAEEV
jgi:predicted MFS family arabinose efflux permease